MSNFKTKLLCGLAITLTSTTTIPTSLAETVYVPIGQQGADKQSIARPRSGMTKTQVKNQYGEPKDWRAAVGEPPISSWVYNDFTVYFEYEHVIHSVLTHQPVN